MPVNGLNIGANVMLEVGIKGQKASRSLIFPVNPDMQRSLNIRNTVTQGYTSVWVDEFGEGIQTITVSGTSAWNSAQGTYNGSHVDGNTAMRHLEMDLVRYYLANCTTNVKLAMYLYDDVRGGAWKVIPVGNVQFTATNQTPIELNFTLQLVVIKDLTNSVGATPKVNDPIKPTFQAPAAIQKQAKQSIVLASANAQKVKQKPPNRYQVQSGDSLWTIAQQYLPKAASNTEVAHFVNEIVTKNHIGNPNLIFPGQILTIPAA